MTGRKGNARFGIQEAYPSKTHMALVALEQRNHLKFLISQNVDGLHRKSGIPSTKLAELHGNTNVEVCEVCGQEHMRDLRVRNAKSVTAHRTGRTCSREGCNGALKDTAINFGEQLNENTLNLGYEHGGAADLCLAMGSSLTITPASTMPESCAKNGGNLVIVNLQSTPLDKLAKLVIHAKCDDVMVLLMKKLGYPIPQWQLKKRLEVSVIENGEKLQFRGVNNLGNPYHLFQHVMIEGLGETQVFPDPEVNLERRPRLRQARSFSAGRQPEETKIAA